MSGQPASLAAGAQAAREQVIAMIDHWRGVVEALRRKKRAADRLNDPNSHKSDAKPGDPDFVPPWAIVPRPGSGNERWMRPLPPEGDG